ncbi:hypothetical protein [Aquisphaera insulae]|uniref:hypothetical protein n=1 Tax=Aquisphaera insulae TaxID=2712864 RepID=UPI0013ED1CA8|nr:hypothetical protein [Aquisphaera insulae]
MASEKLCKSHLIRGGSPPESVQSTHGYIRKTLPIILERLLDASGTRSPKYRNILTCFRHLAIEIELLSPAMRRDGRRPDNCEYPWEADGRVVSPLDWTFHPLLLLQAPAGVLFIKLLREAITHSLAVTRQEP